MYAYYGRGGNTDGWGLIFMLFMIVLIITGIIVVIRYFSRGGVAHNQDEALVVLRKRYANGEIDKKEFEEKRKVLTN
jgi:putative membrane protein